MEEAQQENLQYKSEAFWLKTFKNAERLSFGDSQISVVCLFLGNLFPDVHLLFKMVYG